MACRVGWGWAQTATLAMPYAWARGEDASQLTGVREMPNEDAPSDHLAMGCQLMAPCDLFAL